MSIVSNDGRLKDFIINTLGCNCPEEVFEKIDINSIQLQGCRTDAMRVVVGDRLLIYILNQDAVENIEQLGHSGKLDRDSHHYNRFRLVLSTGENSQQDNTIAESFLAAFDADKKMHIHFVDEQAVKGATGT